MNNFLRVDMQLAVQPVVHVSLLECCVLYGTFVVSGTPQCMPACRTDDVMLRHPIKKILMPKGHYESYVTLAPFSE